MRTQISERVKHKRVKMKRYLRCKFWWAEERCCSCGVPCMDDEVFDPCEAFKEVEIEESK